MHSIPLAILHVNEKIFVNPQKKTLKPSEMLVFKNYLNQI